jgi:hypothetical protein
MQCILCENEIQWRLISTLLFTNKTNIFGRADPDTSWFLFFIFAFILFHGHILSLWSEDIVKYGNSIVGDVKYTSESYKVIIHEKLFP